MRALTGSVPMTKPSTQASADAAPPLAPGSPPEAIHPLGKSPVVTDGDVTVAESGAIMEYLVDTYGDGRLKPAEPIVVGARESAFAMTKEFRLEQCLADRPHVYRQEYVIGAL